MDLMKKIVLILCLFQALYAYPCSIFSYNENGRILFCANEDWISASPAIMIIRSTGNKYGVVLLGWSNYLPNYPQAGVNSEGLCFDWASVPAQKYAPNKDKKTLDINSTIEMLQKCRNIDEAIKYISDDNYPHIAEEHLMLCDKAGSCVIEYTKGELRIIRSKGISQYITNFNLSDKEAGWYPCTRYTVMESRLEAKGLSETDLIAVLKETHQEAECTTQYSYIIDVTALTVQVFLKHQFAAGKVYDIKDLLSSDQKINM
jgi:hypothetical protein